MTNVVDDCVQVRYSQSGCTCLLLDGRFILQDKRYGDTQRELAVSSGADAVVTYNKADFKGIEQFGVKIVSPKDFLKQIGELKWAQSA